MQLSPAMSEPHKYYALSLLKLGQYRESLEHVLPQFRRDPPDRQLRLLVGINYLELGDLNNVKGLLPEDLIATFLKQTGSSVPQDALDMSERL